MVKSLNAASSPVRTSIRRIGANTSISAGDIKAKLSYGSGNVSDSHSILKKAKRDDLRKAGMAVLNTILGRIREETMTVVTRKGKELVTSSGIGWSHFLKMSFKMRQACSI
jgi:hypothetical protein